MNFPDWKNIEKSLDLAKNGFISYTSAISMKVHEFCLLKIVDDYGTILFYISPTRCIFKKEMNMFVEHIS